MHGSDSAYTARSTETTPRTTRRTRLEQVISGHDGKVMKAPAFMVAALAGTLAYLDVDYRGRLAPEAVIARFAGA